MKVSDEVLNLLKYGEKSNMVRARLMLELDVSDQTIMRWARENEKDGYLTRVTVIKLLAEELGVAEDMILTEA